MPGAFWRAAWDQLGLIGDPGAITFEPGATMPDARFFPDGRLSFTENMLAGGGDDDRAAIIWEREDGARRSLSWRELRVEVGAATAALRAAGVEEGDRVAAWMPNVPETVVVMLATLALGAVFTSSSADFGTAGVVDRFGQVEPKVVLAADGYLYGGKQFDCLARLAEIVAALPTVGTVVVVGHVEQEPDLAALADAVAYDAWLAPHRGAPVPATRFGFDQPGFVLYSSGTTGTPKCIVHRAAGVLLKHRTEHSAALRRPPWRRRLLLHDLRVDDVELADECALGRRHDRALRGQPVPSRPGRAARPRRPSRRHAVRRVGEVHRQPAQGRGAATR